MPTSTAEILLVHNPQAGSAHRTQIQRLVEGYFGGRSIALVETRADQNVADSLAPYLQSGIRLVIAAGGDGTVAAAAAALVNRDVPLGILPLGTGNALSRELDIPQTPDQAARLLAGAFDVRRLDVMRVGREIYLLTVSVGLSAVTMRDTRTENKRRFGRAAYIWTLVLNLFGIPRRDFQLEVDGRILNVSANEILVANAGIIGYKALRWGPDVLPDDGHLDLCVVRARSGLDYLRVVGRLLARSERRNESLSRLVARKRIIIRSPAGLPVQGDGDDIGQTPVEIELVPAALNVAVPPAGQGY